MAKKYARRCGICGAWLKNKHGKDIHVARIHKGGKR